AAEAAKTTASGSARSSGSARTASTAATSGRSAGTTAATALSDRDGAGFRLTHAACRAASTTPAPVGRRRGGKREAGGARDARGHTAWAGCGALSARRAEVLIPFNPAQIAVERDHVIRGAANERIGAEAAKADVAIDHHGWREGILLLRLIG